jgi:hypothetical protein
MDWSKIGAADIQKKNGMGGECGNRIVGDQVVYRSQFLYVAFIVWHARLGLERMATVTP